MSAADFQTIRLEPCPKGWNLSFNRPERRNAINWTMLAELHRALDLVEADTSARYLVLRGDRNCFCTGMDFEEFKTNLAQAPALEKPDDAAYMKLLTRFSTTPRIVLAVIEGQAIAGGVGIAAACDLIFASPNSSFSLSEALFGLLPCNLMPFLIRRIGYQRAYRMTLTTATIEARRAYDWGLVDELDEQPESALRKLLPRLAKLDPATVADMKQLFERMWYIEDHHKAFAVSETARLLARSETQERIKGLQLT